MTDCAPVSAVRQRLAAFLNGLSTARTAVLADLGRRDTVPQTREGNHTIGQGRRCAATVCAMPFSRPILQPFSTAKLPLETSWA